jgi:nucleosome binding factor SPN SPT16 subunit
MRELDAEPITVPQQHLPPSRRQENVKARVYKHRAKKKEENAEAQRKNAETQHSLVRSPVGELPAHGTEVPEVGSDTKNPQN